MSVSFVNSGSSQVTTTTSSISVSFNIGTCDTAAFFVVANTGLTISSPQWAGVSAPAVANTSHDDGNSGIVQWFALPVGANTGTHSFTATLSANSVGYAVGFESFNGADLTGGATSYTNGAASDNAGVTTSHTQAITTANGDATVMGSAAGTTFASAASQTPTADWQQNTVGAPLGQGQHQLSTGTSDSYTAVISATDALEMSGFRIKAAAGAAVSDTAGNTIFRVQRPTWR